MNILLELLHPLAGLVVLAEALNKLERIDLLATGLTWRERFVDCLKAVAWLLLGLGAGGALAAPLLLLMGAPGGSPSMLLRLETPTLDQTLVMLGFAVLIVRTRVKEG